MSEATAAVKVSKKRHARGGLTGGDGASLQGREGGEVATKDSKKVGNSSHW